MACGIGSFTNLRFGMHGYPAGFASCNDLAFLLTIFSSRLNTIRYETSVGSDDDGNDIVIDKEVPDNICLESVSFSPQVISRAIRKSKPKTSSGPDGFLPFLLRKLPVA